MRTVSTLIVAVALAVVAAGAAPTRALGAGSEYQQVLHVYERAGSIPSCAFTGPQLESALKGINSYGEQYFADFTQAIQNAIATRAAGGCARSTNRRRRGRGTGARGSNAGRSGPGVGIPAHLGPVTAATDAGVPAPLVLLGVLTALGALGGLGVLAVRAGRPRLTRWRAGP